MMRFAKLLFLLPIPVTIVAINYTVDPAHVFDVKHDYEKVVADLLLNGHNVANIGNCDDRLVQRYYIGGLTSPKDVVVVGASKAMQVTSSFFDGTVVFNNSVQQGVLEDFIAIYEMYHRRGLPPKVMVLGLEPWVLNDHHTINKWMSVEDEVRSAGQRMAICTANPSNQALLREHRALELFSLSYFQASVGEAVRICSGKESRQSCYPTEQSDGEVDIKQTDGSLRYSKQYEARPESTVRSEAVAFANAPPSMYFDNFTALSPSKQEQMEAFVDLLQREGVRVVFFLAPFHPEVYKRFATSTHDRLCVVEAEDYFKQLAVRKNVNLVGSYDPAKCGLDEGEFLDPQHPRMTGLLKLDWKACLSNLDSRDSQRR